MPAAVYVRGYVIEYARALRLDPHRVTESYLARYRAKLPKAAPLSTSADSRSAPQARFATIVFSGSRTPALRAGAA